jgi:hypothetical protein
MRKQMFEHLAQHNGQGLSPVALAAVQGLATEGRSAGAGFLGPSDAPAPVLRWSRNSTYLLNVVVSGSVGRSLRPNLKRKAPPERG